MSELRVAPGERSLVLGGVDSDMRNDGRARLDYRPFRVELGLIEQANGSARVRLGRTDVLVGVKAEITRPDPSTPSHGKLTCSVDCAPSASPAFEGRSAEAFGAQLESFLTDALTSHGSVDLKALCLAEGTVCWALYVDAVVVDFGGNLVDTVFLAACAALRDAVLPRVTVVPAMENAEPDLEIADDPCDCIPVPCKSAPLCVTVSVLPSPELAPGKMSSLRAMNLIVDASLAEEACSEARMHVAVTPDGAVAAMSKSGDGSLPGTTLESTVNIAVETARALHHALDERIAAIENSDREVQGGAAFLTPNRLLAAQVL